MARFKDDDEIGGRETGAWRLVPRQGTRIEDALAYEKIATKFLGDFKQELQSAGLSSGRSKIMTLDDGTRIFAVSSALGLANADEIHIDIPTPPYQSVEPIIIFGYILQGLASSDSDPGFSQYLRFSVKLPDGTEYDPLSGDDPAITPWSGSYPDNGAKYLPRVGGADVTAVDVYIARYREAYVLSDSTGPSVLGYAATGCDAASVGGERPGLNSGFSWAVHGTGHLLLDGMTGNNFDSAHGTYGDWRPGVSRDFVYVQDNGGDQPYYPPDYPGGASGWGQDFSKWYFHEQFETHIQYVNLALAADYADSSTAVYPVVDDYTTLNSSHWITKNNNNNGFASDLGFYIDDTSKMILSERYETFGDNQDTVGQGFLFMVNKDQVMKVSQEIINNNDFYVSDTYVSEESPIVSSFWEGSVGSHIAYNVATDSTFVNGGNIRENPIGASTLAGNCRLVYTTLATFTTDYEEFVATVPDDFTLPCEVPSGQHTISIHRWFGGTDPSYELGVNVYLFTNKGNFKLKTTAGTFDGDFNLTSDKKIIIPIGTELPYRSLPELFGMF